MRSKDIVVGEKYAVGRSADLSSRFLAQATVLEAPSDGRVRIRYENASQRGEWYDEPVRNIVGLWTDYKAEQKAIAERKALMLAYMQETAAKLKTLVPKGYKLPWWARGDVFGDGSYATSGDVGLGELVGLMQTAYDYGAASVKDKAES